jgi:hypothetical protein
VRLRGVFRIRLAVATLIAGVLLPTAAQAQADPPPPQRSAGEQIAFGLTATFDVLILRPLGVASTAVGSVLFVPVALLTAPNGMESVEEAFELFVSMPAKSVYERPLGDF